MNIFCRFIKHRWVFVEDVPTRSYERRSLICRWSERCPRCGSRREQAEVVESVSTPLPKTFGTVPCQNIVKGRHGPDRDGICDHPQWNHGFWYVSRSTMSVWWHDEPCINCRCTGFIP